MGSKFGIIFAFLLSVAAAGGSYYLYQGWVEERTVRGSLEAKYDQVKEKMVTVQSEKEQLKAKSEEFRSKAEAMQGQVEKLQSDQSRIDSEKEALETQLKDRQNMIADLQQKVGDLEKKAKEAMQACNVTPMDVKTDLSSAPMPFENAEPSTEPGATGAATETGSSKLVFQPSQTNVSSASVNGVVSVPTQVKSVTSAVAAVGTPAMAPSTISPTNPATPAPAGSVQTPKVLTVNRKFNFVVINQGLQDGLKMGDKLKVLKHGQESATLQIEKLYDKFSAATLLEENPKQQVVEGDEIRKA